MVGLADCAVKEYHTSNLTPDAQPAVVPAVKVALLVVPVTLLQLVDETNVVGLAQRSLAGACALALIPPREISDIISIAL